MPEGGVQASGGRKDRQLAHRAGDREDRGDREALRPAIGSTAIPRLRRSELVQPRKSRLSLLLEFARDASPDSAQARSEERAEAPAGLSRNLKRIGEEGMESVKPACRSTPHVSNPATNPPTDPPAKTIK